MRSFRRLSDFAQADKNISARMLNNESKLSQNALSMLDLSMATWRIGLSSWG